MKYLIEINCLVAQRLFELNSKLMKLSCCDAELSSFDPKKLLSFDDIVHNTYAYQLELIQWGSKEFKTAHTQSEKDQHRYRLIVICREFFAVIYALAASLSDINLFNLSEFVPMSMDPHNCLLDSEERAEFFELEIDEAMSEIQEVCEYGESRRAQTISGLIDICTFLVETHELMLHIIEKDIENELRRPATSQPAQNAVLEQCADDLLTLEEEESPKGIPSYSNFIHFFHACGPEQSSDESAESADISGSVVVLPAGEPLAGLGTLCNTTHPKAAIKTGTPIPNRCERVTSVTVASSNGPKKAVIRPEKA